MVKKLESSLMNMILSLVLISVCMSAALAFVYIKTKGPIEQAARQKETDAIKTVLPPFDSDPLSDQTKIGNVVIYTAKKQDKIAGYAVKSSTEKGFGGHIELMTGFLPDGSINDIAVLEHKETPGLGTKMTDQKFKSQFIGKNPASFKLMVKKDNGEVDAITAATISSRAYCDALQKAYNSLKQKNDSVSYKQ
jgi:electron transport complex protein RnfG